MQKIVVFTGSGISAESGIKTFRDSGGLWEEYDIMEVATPEAWKRNSSLVLDFYNKRRKQITESIPNPAHLALAKLEKKYDTWIITQNIDDLHERAGSKKVLHLHGEICKSRSTADCELIYDIKGSELNLGDICEKGSQLRPHIVWFGEEVPKMEEAAKLTASADVFIIIGTSLNVYPAAGLKEYTKYGIPIYLIDPNAEAIKGIQNMTLVREKAGTGVPMLVKKLLS